MAVGEARVERRWAAFDAPYAPSDESLVAALLQEVRLDEAAERRVDAEATRLIQQIRNASGVVGALEDFLHEYGLSTREGLALMVLAEALLRVPDAETADRLIEEKLGSARWQERSHRSDSWLVGLTTWMLGLGSRIVAPNDSPEAILRGLVHRLGLPAVRAAARRAVKILAHHFVLGETIDQALERAQPLRRKGYRHSFDMLGEGARTMADAERYFRAYAEAIAKVADWDRSGTLPDRPGISVKLSALHPRFEPLQRERVLEELGERLLLLARMAKERELNLTVDAEEADRLELTLELFARTASDPSLRGWDGFGLAVQAYQKRALKVVDWLVQLAEQLERRFMIRLVKGAYWDTEIKRAQERGLEDYPVFTRKPATDLNYLACAGRLLAARPHIYPQFATHNALTVATLLELAGPDRRFEFQRLHGMGEALYEALRADGREVACRIYAPVGGHRDLLAYLVRRLLENGANSSFVAVVRDRSVPIAQLLTRPAALIENPDKARHPRIPLPGDLYAPERRNSRGVEFGHRSSLEALLAESREVPEAARRAASLVDGRAVREGEPRAVISPIDGTTAVGEVWEAAPELAEAAMEAALRGWPGWSRRPVEERCRILERAADLLEERRGAFLALLAVEAGKTLADRLAEVREAVDFLRYYAQMARKLFAEPIPLPGPTGEDNRYGWRARGLWVCISPWNFPLAIFTGQIAAALVAGNAVVAKPAEQTPLVGALMVRLLHEAGVPGDALQFLPGDGALGARLVAHPAVAGVAFTGSTATAWSINRTLAAKDGPIVPLVAETGGINAMIVDSTALAEQVCDDVLQSAFRSAGQRCSALRLLCLQEETADAVLRMIEGAARELRLGDPRDPATDIGPVIEAEAKDNLLAHVEAMRKRATLRFAGAGVEGALARGHYVAPHIIELSDPSELTREVFGPILHVVRYQKDGLDTLLAAIRATGYGLTLGIHSRLHSTAAHIIDQLPVGNVYVNRNMIGAVVGTQPFGGSGLSGTGFKAGGPAYLTRFALEQVVSDNIAASGGNASLLAETGERW